jgi:ABC-type protease/lipase transport system fused ATPase/permease subunit
MDIKEFSEKLAEATKELGVDEREALLGVFVAGLGLAMSLFSQKLIDDILPSNNIKKLVSGIGLLTVLLLARVGIASLREFFLLQQSKDFNKSQTLRKTKADKKMPLGLLSILYLLITNPIQNNFITNFL